MDNTKIFAGLRTMLDGMGYKFSTKFETIVSVSLSEGNGMSFLFWQGEYQVGRIYPNGRQFFTTYANAESAVQEFITTLATIKSAQ